jgi:ribonuclease R
MSTNNKGPNNDPMAEREAAQYEFPVPSREAVLQLLEDRGMPLSFDDIIGALGVSGERDLDAFARRLRAMERDGQVLKNRRGLYGLPQKMNMVRGRVIGHPDGFGFLVPEEGGDDLFLSPKEMRVALHGDRVLARVVGQDSRGRPEGAVVEVLERARRHIVGRYATSDHVGFVIPHDRRISQDVLIPRGEELKAREGQIVVAEIVDWPTHRNQPVGRVMEIVGEHLGPGMEIEVALRSHDLPHAWPESALREARAFASTVPPEATQGRVDLRAVPLVTIDGEDARDFDDAVYAERDGKGFKLLVAIADVSAYVRTGSALDQEAYARGNSVYFPRRVIPMLPEELSNGLCSLNPDVDRLCMVCEMHVDANGKIGKHRFYEGVMRSQARLTYTKVASMLVDKDAQLRREYERLVPHLENLYLLFKALNVERVKRGAVDFELPETKIIFDDNQKIKQIVPTQRNDAHKLIEECMLAANVCAADVLRKNKIPAPYRIHEVPPADKLIELRAFLGEIGLSLGGGARPRAQDYSKLVRSVEKRPDARLINTVLLRSLSQAMYSPENVGHFALGYEHYAHFTSPIRRYPDLVVHRAIKSTLKREQLGLSMEKAHELGVHCSMTERRADEATREVVRLLKAQYMQQHVGDEFDGIITGVTQFGIFVELSEVYVDGLVHITALGNDYFLFEPKSHRLIGERTRTIFRLGDKLRVRVMRVDLDEAKIDFELAQPVMVARHPTSRRGGGKKKRKR